MADKLDFKKQYKDLYLPKRAPGTIDVPGMRFIAVDGTGEPGGDSYREAVNLLYSLTFAIKMSKMGAWQPDDYVDYAAPPLEGFWEEQAPGLPRREWRWTSVLRQPEFVDQGVLDWAKGEAARKKPRLDYDRARLWDFTEGLCVQMMHTGPYAEEPASLERMRRYMEQEGLAPDLGGERRHHELYLSDPQRTAPENLKTVLRLPAKRI